MSPDRRDGITADERIASLAESEKRRLADQLEKDAIALLKLPAFRRYVCHVAYGKLKLTGGGAWRRDSEIHREAARRDVAAELLGELAELDPVGYGLLEQERVNRLASELEHRAALKAAQERDS